MNPLLSLAQTWRERAAHVREWTADAGAAKAFEAAAGELEAALCNTEDEALTLSKAADESGYSERRLRELVAEGAVPNAGRKGAPRIRRADLPKKVQRNTSPGGYDAAADARAILSRTH